MQPGEAAAASLARAEQMLRESEERLQGALAAAVPPPPPLVRPAAPDGGGCNVRGVARRFISLFPATEGVVAEFDAHPSVSRPLATMLSTLRHRGGKRKEGESGAVADEDPDDGDGYAVKMLRRPKQATSRSLADTPSSWWKNGVFTLRRCKGARMRSSVAKSVPTPRGTCIEGPVALPIRASLL